MASVQFVASTERKTVCFCLCFVTMLFVVLKMENLQHVLHHHLCHFAGVSQSEQL